MSRKVLIKVLISEYPFKLSNISLHSPIVRILESSEQGDQFQEGEILVVISTNIEWTLLFPSAKAITTDIGAPLSHAAIVARELGIPAVVGTNNATMILKTGDKILVEGSKVIVNILERA